MAQFASNLKKKTHRKEATHNGESDPQISVLDQNKIMMTVQLALRILA